MNYTPIHTNIYPNYNYLSAENAYLKQNIEYKDAVLCEQQATIAQLKTDVARMEHDAKRWHVMKKIIFNQGGEAHANQVQAIVDNDIKKIGDKS